MAGWARKAASVVFVFLTTWGITIMYWRNSGNVPTGMEMLMYLGVLPAGISGGGFFVQNLARRGVDKALDNAQQSSPSPSRDESHEDSVTVAPVSSVALLASEINLGVGLNAPSLLAVAGAPPQPALSTRFRDSQNLPLRVVSVEGLDELLVVAEREGAIDTTARERRALALLAPVLDELIATVAVTLPEVEAAEEVVVAGLRRQDEGRVRNELTVELMVSLGWSDALRHWVQAWLERTMQEMGIDARRFDVDIRVVTDAADGWKRIGQVVDALADGAPRWHLLLACDSTIDPMVIAEWQANGTLATARSPDGHVPGEGAAGVLLASAMLGTQYGAALQRPHLLDDGGDPMRRPAEKRRQLTAAAQRWSQTTAVDAGGLQFVLHDGQPHNDGAVEAAMVGATLNPDLDFGLSNLSLTACAGEIGPVLPLAQLALALAQTRKNSDAVLLLTGSAAQQRMLVLVEPFSSPLQAADNDLLHAT